MTMACEDTKRAGDRAHHEGQREGKRKPTRSGGQTGQERELMETFGLGPVPAPLTARETLARARAPRLSCPPLAGRGCPDSAVRS